MKTPIGKARGEGNCVEATRRGEEVCECVVKLAGTIVASRILTSVALVTNRSGELGQEPHRAVGRSRVPRLRLSRPTSNDQRVGQERPPLQAPHSRTDGEKSRHLDGRPPDASATLLARVGGLLRVGGAVETVRQVRPVDSSSSACVLLETLATGSHARPESIGSRRPTPPSLPSREESQRPVAHGEIDRYGSRPHQRLAARARTCLAEIPLGPTCSPSSNRVVRTRTLRGVGRAVSNDRPYPILCFSDDANRRSVLTLQNPFSISPLSSSS